MRTQSIRRSIIWRTCTRSAEKIGACSIRMSHFIRSGESRPRTGLCQFSNRSASVEKGIEKRRPETGGGNLPTWRRVQPLCASRDLGNGTNLRKCRGSYTASPETILAGWAYRIRTGLCRLVGRFEPPHGGIKIRCFEQWDHYQKGLDFLCVKSVTVGGRRAPSTLPGSCPAGFRARAGLWW
jgi:hypothetical protein